MRAGNGEDRLQDKDGYMPYKGLDQANQNSRKFGVFRRKLEGSHSLFYGYFEEY